MRPTKPPTRTPVRCPLCQQDLQPAAYWYWLGLCLCRPCYMASHYDILCQLFTYTIAAHDQSPWSTHQGLRFYTPPPNHPRHTAAHLDIDAKHDPEALERPAHALWSRQHAHPSPQRSHR